MTFGFEPPAGRWRTPEELLELAEKLADQTAKRKKEMGNRMSRDRVEFRPGVYTSNYHVPGGYPSNKHRFTREALVKAMGINVDQADAMVRANTLIRCRPSQFARFIIYRHDAGIDVNGIKCLHPALIVPEPPACEPVDVSGNPAAHDRD